MAKNKPTYALPLVHVSVAQGIILHHAHERMEGAMMYINTHPNSCYIHDAARRCHEFFERIEALIPQEDA